MRKSAAYLAFKDWMHEFALSLCAVLAVASIVTPLLILFGVRTGVIDHMRENLKNDPSVLVLMPEGSRGAGFTEKIIRAIQSRKECSFCIGRTRDVASELMVRKEGSPVSITLEATEKNDPLLMRAHLSPPSPGHRPFEIVLSAQSAKKLGVKAGDMLSASISRRLATGKYEKKDFELTVTGILPEGIIGTDTGFVPLSFLFGIQDYRDGKERGIFSAQGEESPGEARFFESFRAYARNIDAVEPFEAWFASQNIPVKTRSRDIANVRSIDQTLSAIILIISAASIVGLFAFMASTVHASVRRKWKVLGMLRLLGYSRMSLLLYPVSQAFLTGICGLVTAFVLYLLVSNCIDLFFAAHAGGYAICVLHGRHIFFICLFIVLLLVGAAFNAGFKASRIDPSLVIREN